MRILHFYNTKGGYVERKVKKLLKKSILKIFCKTKNRRLDLQNTLHEGSIRDIFKFFDITTFNLFYNLDFRDILRRTELF